ncbi:MAG: hypothetical protein GX946_02080 [Oligosphaeraceae bacterium]|nr:hypothetical protein [Oligosphaeraceae bacterium]
MSHCLIHASHAILQFPYAALQTTKSLLINVVDVFEHKVIVELLGLIVELIQEA